MKGYKEPVVEVIDFPEADILTSSSPKGTGSDEETGSGSIFSMFTSKNGMPFD